MNIPPDDNNNPPPPGLGFDPNTSAAMLGDISLTGQNKSKAPLIILGVLVAAGIGFFVWQSKKTRDERVKHAQFMEDFQRFEQEDLSKFWACTLGPKADGTAMQSPDQVTRTVDVMFANDFKAYPQRLGDECATIAKEVASKAKSLVTLSDYDAPVDAYGKSIIAMSDALTEWAKSAPAQVEAKMAQKNFTDYSAAWHAYQGGPATKEIMGYDQFLHCAVPDVDTNSKYKDNLELAKSIFEQCKQLPYAEKLNADCGKRLTTDQTAPTKDWKKTIQKFASDDREQQGLEACMKKGRKGKIKDNLAPVGQAWVAFREAREGVLKVGADVLKAK